MGIDANLIKVAIDKLSETLNIGYNKQENKFEVNFRVHQFFCVNGFNQGRFSPGSGS